MSLQGGFLDEFLEIMCPFKVIVRMGLMFGITLLLLLGVAWTSIEPGTPSYVVFWMSVVVVVVAVAGMVTLLWLCERPFVNE